MYILLLDTNSGFSVYSEKAVHQTILTDFMFGDFEILITENNTVK